jgi:stringent starvation protein B
MNTFESEMPSTRPYLIRALHEWCVENGFSPYIAVQVDASVKVPMEFVKNGEIVLNVGMDATSALRLGNDFIEFKARFGGVAREIIVPVSHVVAIYARENGQGMAFPAPPAATVRANIETRSEITLTTDSEPVEAVDPTESLRSVLRSVPTEDLSSEDKTSSSAQPSGGSPKGGGRPQLTRIK